METALIVARATIPASPAQSEVALWIRPVPTGQNVGLIGTSRAWQDGRKEYPVRGRRVRPGRLP